MKQGRKGFNQIGKVVSAKRGIPSNIGYERTLAVFQYIGWLDDESDIDEIYFSESEFNFFVALVEESYSDYFKSRIDERAGLVTSLAFENFYRQAMDFRNTLLPLAECIEDEDVRLNAVILVKNIFIDINNSVLTSGYIINNCDEPLQASQTTIYDRLNDIKDFIGIKTQDVKNGKSKVYDIQDAKLLMYLLEEACNKKSYFYTLIKENKTNGVKRSISIEEEYIKSKEFHTKLSGSLKYVYDADYRKVLEDVIDRYTKLSYYELLVENYRTFGIILDTISSKVGSKERAIEEFERLNGMLIEYEGKLLDAYDND
tara:strand:- start:557 stop:1501 length:945 start_codon:yes stop_codon:yes gene_type:complete